MNQTNALSKAIIESVMNVDERFDGYREVLVKHLAIYLRDLDKNGVHARRISLERHINLLADLLATRTGEKEKER